MAKLRQGKRTQQVNRERAQGFVNMCTTRVLAHLLDEMRSLRVIQTTPPDQEERLFYKECKKYFGDLCMVMVPRDVARPVTCTCELFSKCAECPHTLAVLELLKRNSPPLLGSPLPLGFVWPIDQGIGALWVRVCLPFWSSLVCMCCNF